MIGAHLTPIKQRVRITVVNPATRSLQGTLRDGATIPVTVFDVAHAFIWPVVGEQWTVTRESGVWLLGQRIESLNDTRSIESLDAGEGQISADVLVDRSGRTFVAVDLTSIAHGESIVWDSVVKRFVPSSDLSPAP